MKTGSPSSQTARAQLGLTSAQVADFNALGIPEKLLEATHQLAPRLDLSALLPKLKTISGGTRSPAFPHIPWQMLLLSGDAQALKQLSSQPDWDALTSHEGLTPCHYAAYSGNPACLSWVCEQLEGETAELLKQKDDFGCTVLHYAAESGNPACLAWVCKQLEGETAELLKQKDDFGRTALHYAAWSGKQECLFWLCEQLNGQTAELLKQKDNAGRTALHWAALSGSSELWSLLIQDYPALAPYFWQPAANYSTPFSRFPTLLNLLHEEIENRWQALSTAPGKVTSDKQAYNHALKWFQQYAKSWQAYLNLTSEVNSSNDTDSFLHAVFEALATSLDAKADDPPEKRCLSEVARLPHPELKIWLKALVLAHGAVALAATSAAKSEIRHFEEAEKQALEHAVDDCFGQFYRFIESAQTVYHDGIIPRLIIPDNKHPLKLSSDFLEVTVSDDEQYRKKEHALSKDNKKQVVQFTEGVFPNAEEVSHSQAANLAPHQFLNPEAGQSRALLLGEAGSGKSTLSRFISYAWANRENEKNHHFAAWRERYNLVVLLPFRWLLTDFFKDKANYQLHRLIGFALKYDALTGKLTESLPELLETQAQNFESLLKFQAQMGNILFILDGFDEIISTLEQEQCHHPELINELLCSLLRFPHVLVSSRPHPSSALAGRFDFQPPQPRNFRITGFKPNKLESYPEHFFRGFHDNKKHIERTKTMLKNPELRALCKIPISYELVCSIVYYDSDNQVDLANLSQTKLYQQVIDLWYWRYLGNFKKPRLGMRQQNQFKSQTRPRHGLATSNCLTDEQPFLADWAFELEYHRQLTLPLRSACGRREKYYKQVKDMAPEEAAEKVDDMIVALWEVGFIKGINPEPVSEYNSNEMNFSYYFPHKTFQEYFAAVYIRDTLIGERKFHTPGQEEKVNQLIESECCNSLYQKLWPFVVGLLKENAQSNEIRSPLNQFFSKLIEAAPRQFGVYYFDLLIRCWEEAGIDQLGEAITQKLTDNLIESLISRFNDYWETGETHYELFNTLKLCPHVRRHLYEEEKWRNAIKENIKTLQPDETCARQLKLLIECKLVERSFWHKGFLARVTESPLIVCYAKAIIENNQPLRNACWQIIAANLEIFIAAANRDDFRFDADCYYTEISSALSELNQNPSLWTSVKAPQNQYWAAVFFARFLHEKSFAQSAFKVLFDFITKKNTSDDFVKPYSLKSMFSQQAPGLGYLALSTLQLINIDELWECLCVDADLVNQLASSLYRNYPEFPILGPPTLNRFEENKYLKPPADYEYTEKNWKLRTIYLAIAVNLSSHYYRGDKVDSIWSISSEVTFGLWWLSGFHNATAPEAMLENFSRQALSLSELWIADSSKDARWRGLFSHAIETITDADKLGNWHEAYRYINSSEPSMPDKCFEWLIELYEKFSALPYAQSWLFEQLSNAPQFIDKLITQDKDKTLRTRALGNYALKPGLTKEQEDNLIKHQALLAKVQKLSEKLLSAALTDHEWQSGYQFNFSASSEKTLYRQFMPETDSAQWDAGWSMAAGLFYGLLLLTSKDKAAPWSTKAESVFPNTIEMKMHSFVQELEVAKPIHGFRVDTLPIAWKEPLSRVIPPLIAQACSQDRIDARYQVWSNHDNFKQTFTRALAYAQCAAGESRGDEIIPGLSAQQLYDYLKHAENFILRWPEPLVQAIGECYQEGGPARISQRIALYFSAMDCHDEFIVDGLHYHLQLLRLVYASQALSRFDLSEYLDELLERDNRFHQRQLALMLESTPIRALIEYALKMKSSNTDLLKTISNRLLQAQQTLSIEDACLRLSGENEPIDIPRGLALTAQTLLNQLHLMISPEYAETLQAINRINQVPPENGNLSPPAQGGDTTNLMSNWHAHTIIVNNSSATAGTQAPSYQASLSNKQEYIPKASSGTLVSVSRSAIPQQKQVKPQYLRQQHANEVYTQSSSVNQEKTMPNQATNILARKKVFEQTLVKQLLTEIKTLRGESQLGNVLRKTYKARMIENLTTSLTTSLGAAGAVFPVAKVGTAPAAVVVKLAGMAASSHWAAKAKERRSAGQAELEGIDEALLVVYLTQFSKLASLQYEHAIAKVISQKNSLGVLPLAQVAALRVVDYLCQVSQDKDKGDERHKDKSLMELMLEGLMRGRSGKFIEAAKKDFPLKSIGGKSLNIEGVFSKGAMRNWETQEKEDFSFRKWPLYYKAKPESTVTDALKGKPSRGYTAFFKSGEQAGELKYGYLLATKESIDAGKYKRLDIESYKTNYKLPKNQYRSVVAVVGKAEVLAYVKALSEEANGSNEAPKSFLAYLQEKQRPDIAEVWVRDATFTKEDVLDKGDFSEVDFSGCEFKGKQTLSNLNLNKARMTFVMAAEVTFKDVNLNGTNFDYADLSEAYFETAQSNAKIDKAFHDNLKQTHLAPESEAFMQPVLTETEDNATIPTNVQAALETLYGKLSQVSHLPDEEKEELVAVCEELQEQKLQVQQILASSDTEIDEEAKAVYEQYQAFLETCGKAMIKEAIEKLEVSMRSSKISAMSHIKSKRGVRVEDAVINANIHQVNQALLDYSQQTGHDYVSEMLKDIQNINHREVSVLSHVETEEDFVVKGVTVNTAAIGLPTSAQSAPAPSSEETKWQEKCNAFSEKVARSFLMALSKEGSNPHEKITNLSDEGFDDKVVEFTQSIQGYLSPQNRELIASMKVEPRKAAAKTMAKELLDNVVPGREVAITQGMITDAVELIAEKFDQADVATVSPGLSR